MMPCRRLLLLALLLLVAPALHAQVPHPRDVLGFEPGADYQLADYDQLLAYYRQLAAASNRVRLDEIGTSVQGQPLILLTISSETNLERLDRLRVVSERLARADVDEAEAEALVQEGRAVVWIDGGLHATEVAGAQMGPLLAYRVATEASREMERIRENVILLLMPVMNPDGLDIVAGWYRSQQGTPFETTSPPWLYHVYVGHDNNRDWFMNTMPESRAVSRVLYHRWYPQIVVNHHQTSPAWARIFIPPFADPVNPNIHPGVTTGVNLVGSAMAHRFAVERMPGVISGQTFSMWWNGGMRTVPYFHNMIGILTEVAHASPTPRYYAPDSIPKTISGLQTNGTQVFYADPWEGGASHLRDAVAYMITASMGVLDVAASMRENWLANIYRMGRDAIRQGREEAPYAYVVPADQRDPGETRNLVEILRIGGVDVHRASTSFRAGGRTYAAGSYVVYAAQAFRPYLVDLLEEQVYPDRRRYPGGPPEVPYDLAGWTLPLQMGVRVDPVDARFSVVAEPVDREGGVEPGAVTGDARQAVAYVLPNEANASVRAANRLLAVGEQLHRSDTLFTMGARTYGAGTYLIERGPETTARIAALAAELGVDVAATAPRPPIPRTRLEAPRVGLYKSWVASMDEGWTRWLLEEYGFAVDTLHDADVRAGALEGYDVVVLPHQQPRALLNGHPRGTMPEAYVGGLGTEGTLALQTFVERGGTLVAFDEASDFVIEQFGLPLRNVVDGVPPERFFIPGSLVRIVLDPSHVLAYGMPDSAVAVFSQSRAFEPVILPGEREGGREATAAAPPPPVEVVARYAGADLLLSGWAIGEAEHIGGKAAMVRVPYGAGHVVLFGFRPQFRGQSRGTYRLVFNSLFEAAVGRTNEPELAPEE